MADLVFVDSDILFSFFAISEKKIKSFQSSGTTTNNELDIILKLINEIELDNQIVCLSEFSILEIVCTLNRLNSSSKTGDILTKIYKMCDVLPLNDLMIKLAWFIGSNYTLHSGDALHISFCLFNAINHIIIKDDKFYTATLNLQKDFEKDGIKKFNDYFLKISFSQGTPNTIIRKFSNLRTLKIRKI